MNVVQEKHEVRGVLDGLGLKPEWLVDAIRAALIRRESCTEFHPSTYPGFVLWGDTNEQLRQHLVPRGWRTRNEQNVPLVVNPLTSVALTMSSAVGVALGATPEPRTKNPKGAVLGRAINTNNHQRRLFSDADSVLIMPTPGSADLTTWVLLVEIIPGIEIAPSVPSDVVRAEISLPRLRDDRGHIVGWGPRVFLGPVGLDTEGWGSELIDSGTDDEDYLDVPVAMR